MTKLMFFCCLAWAESLHPCLDFLKGRAEISKNLFEKISAPTLQVIKRPLRRIEQPIAEQIPGSILFAEMIRAQPEPFIDTAPGKPDEGLMVFVIEGSKIPNTILELGRLREIAFRFVQAGTGLSRDVDETLDDESYHVIAWQKKPNRKKISGAYRLTLGTASSLYTPTQFEIDRLLTPDFKSQMVEVSRSFVDPDAHNGPTLKYLLGGIAEFVARNPRYRYLAGSASMSDFLNEYAKLFIRDFFMRHHAHPLKNFVSPFSPPNFETSLTPDEYELIMGNMTSIKDLKDWYNVAQIFSPLKVRFPSLYKDYHDLGAKFLGFNHDVQFQTVDGLLIVDVAQIPYEKLIEFMPVKAKQYLDYHHLQSETPSR